MNPAEPPKPVNQKDDLDENIARQIPQLLARAAAGVTETNKPAAAGAAGAEAAAPAAAGGSTEEITDTQFPIYLIVPSTPSRIMTVLVVLIIYFIYVALITFMTSYNSKFVPNFAMLWDFVFGINTTKYQDEFNQYVQNTMLYAAANVDTLGTEPNTKGRWEKGVWVPKTADTFVGGGATTTTTEPSTDWVSLAITSFQSVFQELRIFLTRVMNQLMVQTFVSGNKVKVARMETPFPSAPRSYDSLK